MPNFCRNQPLAWPIELDVRRTFTASASNGKKAGKSKSSPGRADVIPAAGTTITSSRDEALDLSSLEAKFLKAIENLTHDLAQLRAGGRLSPELIEELRVQLGKGDDMKIVKLKDIAQVVPRGRVVNVIVGESEHIKPVNSAILGSSHSLNPQQPSPDNPLTIPVPIPPPTGESRRKVIEMAQEAAKTATAAIQSARGEHQKKLRKFEVDQKVRPDDLRKAHKKMEELVQKNIGEVKTIAESAKRALEG